MPGIWRNGHVSGLYEKVKSARDAFQELAKEVEAGTRPRLSADELYSIAEETGDSAMLPNAIAWSKALRDVTGTEVVCTTRVEVEELCAAIDLTGFDVVLDPWAGLGMVEHVLTKLPVKVVSSDANPLLWWTRAWDALSDEGVRCMKDVRAPVVVTSPVFSLLDIAVPRLLELTTVVTCIHVPSHYLTNMPAPRYQLLTGMVQQGRLVALGLRAMGPVGRRCAWLVIFADATWKEALLKKSSGLVPLPFYL